MRLPVRTQNRTTRSYQKTHTQRQQGLFLVLHEGMQVNSQPRSLAVWIITPPPPRKYYEMNSPRIFLCNFWGGGGGLRQNCVITKKLIPQDFFCVIGDRRDLRLAHVELRKIYVTPKKYFSENFWGNWLRDTVAITPKIIHQEFFCVSHFFEGGGKGRSQASTTTQQNQQKTRVPRLNWATMVQPISHEGTTAGYPSEHFACSFSEHGFCSGCWRCEYASTLALNPT